MAEAEIRGLPAAAMAEAEISGLPEAAMAESENIGVVSKVFSELNSKLGLRDNEFAEFVVNLGRNCGTLEEFGDRLKELGIDIPNYVIFSLYTKIYEDLDVSKSDLEFAIKMSIEDYVIRERRQNLRERRQNLPIYSVKDDLIKAVNDNRILIVSGGVGSGKTSQITQYLVESGYTSNGRLIGCTQPHIEFVKSVAIRVAEEYGCELGQQVGYATTLEDYTSESTLIKYMAHDLLLWEFMEDPKLSKYSVIVIDEADARTAFTDVLIAIMLKHFVLDTNHDLRLVVVTSPLDCYPQKLAGFLLNSHVFTIPTTTYPVDIVYLDKPPSYLLFPAMETIAKIIVEESPGDILLFWSRDGKIDQLVYFINELVTMHQTHITRDLVVLLVDRLLDPSIFEPAPPGKRKLLIVSTRFTEVCLSIDGIRYVVDPGVSSLGVFDPNQGLYLSGVQPISQESAMQRAILAGRMDKGKCFRLYTQEFYRDQMPPTYPEIQRLNLCSIMLYMKALGMHDLLSFYFMDPPPSQALTCATKRLHVLGALDERGHLTQLGWKMAGFPLDPPLSKMLMASVDLGCSDEILAIISMIQTEATYIPPTKREHLVFLRAKFRHPEGDLLTMLAIFEDGKAHNFSEQWCLESGICPAFIQRARVSKNKLVRILQEKCKLEVVSAEGNSLKIRQAITSGFFFNAAKKDGNYWRLVDNRHGSNSSIKHIHGNKYSVAERVVAVWVSEQTMNGITVVDPQWLPGSFGAT